MQYLPCAIYAHTNVLTKGKLALSTWEYYYGNSDFQYCIWMMEYGVVESQNKLFVIGSFKQNIHCSALTKYGSLILCFVNHRVERTGFEFALIDTETLHEKKDPDINYPSYVATFKESLLLHKCGFLLNRWCCAYKNEVISGMDEVKPLLFHFLKFSIRYDSIAKNFIFIPGLR